ncbi:uncharacterized protein TNIN_447271 [Trichonephila inaurata madagascariensis]|uniref:Peptidase aspartic putative domain-containing protein n=1 Tax=Trichonephila inaurata madagascariensis TaxID=2747483 RepID=A0A8X7CJ47_9ARAC|nr:uncharacterized protein TNIN_447271 [Trichonephila inaurata madagascariensis]
MTKKISYANKPVAFYVCKKIAGLKTVRKKNFAIFAITNTIELFVTDLAKPVTKTNLNCQENNKNDSLIKSPHAIYLQTATTTVKSSTNEENLPVRILLDNGSMRTFILKEVSQELKLPIVRNETLSVYFFGVDEAQEKIYDVVKIRLENRDKPSLYIEIEVLVTDKISATNLPAPETNIPKVYKQLKSLQLADSYEYKENKIVILIGSDFHFQVVTGRIKRLDNKLVASETIFGWCIQGQGDFRNQLLSMEITIVKEKSISDQMREIWELENLGINVDSENKDSTVEEIMRKFEEGISCKDKRYKVKLPWKPEMKNALHNNKEVASRRFQTLKKSFINDPVYFSEYSKVLEDYRKENIIESVTEENEILSEDNCFYLPHRAVIREDKTTTRLRVVFDTSSHSKGQLSLNDCLHTGFNLLPDLFLLLIRFRTYSVVVTADIKQAFLQIEIHEEDRNYTRFLWTADPENSNSGEIPETRPSMTRVLFGVTSSPFLLNAIIKHHLKSMYLRKWRTNSPELFHNLKERNLEVDDSPDFYNQTLVPSKVLGVAWNPKEDYFYFDTQSLEKFLLKSKDTKRYILEIAGRIFDPIGYIGPYTIRIKCLIQKIWCLGLDWDEIVPDEIFKIFNDWCYDLKKLSNIRITRHYFSGALPKDIHNIELHLFSDASIKAYGTVAYLRVELNDGNIITSFVASKGKVTPLKTLSLPHLESTGALLSARLSEKIMKGLEFPVQRIFWTDSSIVFFWTKGSPDKFKVFIKNRIQEIHKCSNPSEWFHCPGKDNPNDLISRELSVAELENSDFWWQGPSWLREKKSSWPKPLETHKEVTYPETLEIRKTLAVNTVMKDTNQNINNFIKKYSSFTKLIRITAYCLRFLKNCRITQSDKKRIT